jgi:AraC family transcriptional activator of pobA
MKSIYNSQNAAVSSLTDISSFYMKTIESIHSLKLDSLSDYNNQFAIVWITKGNGNYWINARTTNSGNNCLIFIKPGQFNRLQLHNAFEGYIFFFSKLFLGIEDHDSELLLSSLHQMFKTKLIYLKDEHVGEMHDLACRMLKEFNHIDLYRGEVLRRYFKIFLIYLSRYIENLMPASPQSRNIELLQNFMSLLEQNFRQYKMVADYADFLAVSPNYLNEVVKKVTGFPAGYHIRQRIALEAKRKAAYSDVGMKEVAYDLGFFDLAHFSKYFKNATGMSFSNFRKNGIGVEAA